MELLNFLATWFLIWVLMFMLFAEMFRAPGDQWEDISPFFWISVAVGFSSSWLITFL